MNKYKRLLGNSVIFAFGNLGSKLIAIMLVPFYTYLLSTGEYGTVDLITTTVNMLLPIISLSTFDTVLRFVLDKKENNQVILSNAFFITIVGCFVFLLIIPVFDFLKIQNGIYLYCILAAQAFQSMLSEYARASNHIKLFAFNGIFGAFITAIANIVLMYFFKLGIVGYLISLFIAAVGSIILLGFKLKINTKISYKLVQKKILRKMLVYSIPLIPNALAWWVNNASSRYFILYFVGVSANGLFAVANKIPSLLNMLNSIFFQSWQISAIEEYNSESRAHFYSKVFSVYCQFLFISSVAILLVLKPFMLFAVARDFYSAWRFVPLLLLAVIYSSFSGFLGTNYVAAKKTVGVMTTTIIGAILNVVFCFLFVPLFKVNGAGLSSALSFFCIWLLRIYDTKKFININLNVKNILFNHILFLGVYLVLLLSNIYVSELIGLFLLVLLLFVDKELTKNVFKIVKNRIKINWKK